jgi:hypothetical protein
VSICFNPDICITIDQNADLVEKAQDGYFVVESQQVATVG